MNYTHTHSATSLNVVLVANGDIWDPNVVSGVPYYLAKAFSSHPSIAVVATINASPSRPARWIARALTFHPRRSIWDQRYVHSTLLARMRSMKRDRALRRLKDSPDVVLHVRSWYYPCKVGTYAAFIDATSEMLQGVSPQWTSAPVVHRRKVRVERQFYRHAKVIFTASRAAKEDLLVRYDINEKSVHVTGNGLNFTPFPTAASSNVGSTQRPVIIFVGKDPIRKGLPELQSSFADIRKVYPTAELWIVGSPSDVTGEGIHNLGLITERNLMSQLYERASIFCLPARQESFGLVVPEAMAHGLPCVVTDTGELPHIVDDGKSGFVVPVGGHRELTLALKDLLGDPEKRLRMGAHGRERASSMTWSNVATSMIVFFNQDKIDKSATLS